MREWIIFVLFLAFAGTAFSAKPVVFFSDLTNGPVSGWNGSSTKGAAVSIWGRNFGSSRGSSYVTVGGVNLTDDSDYAEWGATENPHTAMGMERITFWLNSDMELGETTIKVTTSEGTSNAIDFYTRDSGHIYFITPNGNGDGSMGNPFSPRDYIQHLTSGEDGDIGYFRVGTYSGEYGHTGWHANFCMLDSYSGEEHFSNAFIAYPGEDVLITTSEDTLADRSNFRNYSSPASWITVAKFRFYAYQSSLGSWNGWRIVGNDINAIHTLSGAGVIGSGNYQRTCRNIKIYGNTIHGGSSGNKLDHAIYPGSGTSDLEIAWNHIYDNNFGAGPMVSLNCNEAWSYNLTSDNIYIHDNLIDVSLYPSRAMGVFEVGDGSNIYIYNNIIIGSAPNASPSVYAMSGNLRYYNNTLYNCGSSNLGACFSFYSSQLYGHTYSPHVITLRNNVVYASENSIFYVKKDGEAIVDGVSNNVYYNIGNIQGDDLIVGINANPRFVDPDNGDFRLQADSPAIDAGTSSVSSIVKTDFNGTARPQGSGYDIGAYEYVSGTYADEDVNQDGNVNISDVQLVVNVILGNATNSRADVNGSGATDVSDVQLEVNAIVG